jgi:hypothetical protein
MNGTTDGIHLPIVNVVTGSYWAGCTCGWEGVNGWPEQDAILALSEAQTHCRTETRTPPDTRTRWAMEALYNAPETKDGKP